jgi:RNA polymerase-binding protein DksA
MEKMEKNPIENTTEKLNPEAVEQIKNDLLKRKEQLEEDLAEIGQREGEGSEEYKTKFPEFGDKPDENAQEISEYTTNLATEQVLEKNLRDINNALKRIEKGTYGTCKYCGRTINEKRLLARPTASACIECKTKLQNQS